MIESVSKIESIADAADKPGQSPASNDPSSGTGGEAAAQPGVRLYVDHSDTGVFTYRLVDVTTGRLLVEVPREQLDTLAASADYAAGSLVSTSA